LLKFCVKILFCKHYFSPLNTFLRKRKDPGSGSIPLASRIPIPNNAWRFSVTYELSWKKITGTIMKGDEEKEHIFFCLTLFSMAGMFFAGKAGADAE
jgi:hypothetical protein